jgi:hypothetical protein
MHSALVGDNSISIWTTIPLPAHLVILTATIMPCFRDSKRELLKIFNIARGLKGLRLQKRQIVIALTW